MESVYAILKHRLKEAYYRECTVYASGLHSLCVTLNYIVVQREH